jgi:protein gp37
MTKIEWTDATWNPVIGCTPISPGCLNCYAAAMANRMQGMKHAKDYQPRRIGDGVPYGDRETIRIAEVRSGRAVYTGDVRTLPDRLVEPLAWKKPRMVFVCSMSDLFHESVPFDFIDRVFEVMALCPQHTFQVLTKRTDRMAEYMLGGYADRVGSQLKREANQLHHAGAEALAITLWHEMKVGGFLPNVWLGTSVEDQQRADERIPHLLNCPAKVRFLSCEPLLGPLDLEFPLMRQRHNKVYAIGKRLDGIGSLHWVIVGGESGHKARPCATAWIRSIIQQCDSAGVPCFVKQLGSRCAPVKANADAADIQEAFVKLKNKKGGDMAEWAADLRVRQFPGGAAC